VYDKLLKPRQSFRITLYVYIYIYIYIYIFCTQITVLTISWHLLHEFNNATQLSYIFCTKNSSDNVEAQNLPWGNFWHLFAWSRNILLWYQEVHNCQPTGIYRALHWVTSIRLTLRGSFNTNFITLRTQCEKPSRCQPMRSSIKFMNYFKTDTYQLLFLDGMIFNSEGTSFLGNNVIRSPNNTASHPTRSKSSTLIYIICEDSGRTSDITVFTAIRKTNLRRVDPGVCTV